MANKFCHLSYEDRVIIEKELNNLNSITNIANTLNKNYSTILREIKNRKIKYERNGWGVYKTPCAKRQSCWNKHCDFKQPCFVKESCSKLRKSPYVCNGCNSRSGCRKERFTYFAKDANDTYLIKLSDSRKGIDITPEDIEKINKVITPLIKDKGQSINHIFINHSDLLNFSKQTFYNYVEYNLFSFRNMDLPRKVRYKVRKNSKKRRTKAELAIRKGRTYIDFQDYIAKHPDCSIVEMDTVEGIKGGKVFLTLLWRKSKFMLIYIMDKQTMQCVEDIFTILKFALPYEEYIKLFEVILTDNGSEFYNPLSIECDPETGEKLSHLFYCDPSASYQKGALEKNHEFIRYILPKKSSFNNLTQDDCFRMASHINSTARESLNNKTPFEAHTFIIHENFINALSVYLINPDEVVLNDTLIK